jgi:hypothetical protein
LSRRILALPALSARENIGFGAIQGLHGADLRRRIDEALRSPDWRNTLISRASATGAWPGASTRNRPRPPPSAVARRTDLGRRPAKPQPDPKHSPSRP